MIPQTQSRIGERGRCFNACLASILEIPERAVPDFDLDGDDEYWYNVARFLAGHGLAYRQAPLDRRPKGWHTIEGISPRGGMHAVVGHEGRFIHDPHPVEDDPRRGLVKPKHYGLLEQISDRRARLHAALAQVLHHGSR